MITMLWTSISRSGKDEATGEAYCMAHHVTVESGKRRLMIASLRYLDTFVKRDGSWLVRGASAVHRLVGGARTFMTPASEVARMIIRSAPAAYSRYRHGVEQWTNARSAGILDRASYF